MELTITNRKGEKFIVHYDLCDEEIIKKFKWHVTADKDPYARTRYREANGAIKYVFMHRMILGLTSSVQEGDHRNRNRLDNRRKNLRVCGKPQNICNKTPVGFSKYLGVTFRPKGRQKKWRARICSNFKEYFLGFFNTEEEAARAYDEAAKKFHGDFSNLNFKTNDD